MLILGFWVWAWIKRGAISSETTASNNGDGDASRTMSSTSWSPSPSWSTASVDAILGLKASSSLRFRRVGEGGDSPFLVNAEKGLEQWSLESDASTVKVGVGVRTQIQTIADQNSTVLIVWPMQVTLFVDFSVMQIAIANRLRVCLFDFCNLLHLRMIFWAGYIPYFLILPNTQTQLISGKTWLLASKWNSTRVFRTIKSQLLQHTC